MASFKYAMELRLANPLYGIPRIYVDVKILGRVFAACINTFSRRTLVDFAIKVFLTRRDPAAIHNHISPYPEETIPVPIEYHMQHSVHAAIVCYMEEGETLIELGLDFLYDRGMEMTLGGTKLDMRQSWVSKHFDQVEYVFNHKQGENAKNFLHEQNYEMKQDFRRKSTDPKDFLTVDSMEEIQRDTDKFGD